MLCVPLYTGLIECEHFAPLQAQMQEALVSIDRIDASTETCNKRAHEYRACLSRIRTSPSVGYSAHRKHSTLAMMFNLHCGTLAGVLEEHGVFGIDECEAFTI